VAKTRANPAMSAAQLSAHVSGFLQKANGLAELIDSVTEVPDATPQELKGFAKQLREAVKRLEWLIAKADAQSEHLATMSGELTDARDAIEACADQLESFE
jgi:ABC-type transporter Mla subunit MlaD